MQQVQHILATFGTIPAPVIAVYLLAVNLGVFLAFGIDKAQARGGGRRISEAALLGWSLLGGIGGAYAARSFFRHETRKQTFSNELHSVAILQAALLAFVAVLYW